MVFDLDLIKKTYSEMPAKVDAAKNALRTGKLDEYFNIYGASVGDPVYQQMLEAQLH